MNEKQSTTDPIPKPPAWYRRRWFIIAGVMLALLGVMWALNQSKRQSDQQAIAYLESRGYQVKIGTAGMLDNFRLLLNQLLGTQIPGVKQVVSIDNKDTRNVKTIPYAGMKGSFQLGDAKLVQLTAEDWTAIRRFTHLTDLHLTGANVTDNDMRRLAKLSLLNTLDLSDNLISDQGLTHLKKLTRIQNLNLAKTKITDIGLANFALLTHITTLTLSSNNLTGAGFEVFAQMPSLRVLKADHNQLIDQHLAPLADLPLLMNLDLSHNQLTGAGLPPLPNAVIVNFSNNQIGGSGLPAMPSVSHLDLSHNQITDQDMPSLIACVRLGQLDLSYNPLTNTGAEHLKSIPSLFGIIMRGTQMTRKKRVEIQRELPEIGVIITAPPREN